MNEYRWIYVESVRTSKATGKVSRKLKIILCKGREVVGEFPALDTAIMTEKLLKNSGEIFKSSINEYLDDYKASVDARWKNKPYESKLKKIRPADFKLFLKGEYDPK